MTDLEELVARLRAAGCVFAEREAELITDTFPDDGDRERATVRRVAGEPLEYVVGSAAFAGITVAIGPPAFVPRVRAVALVDALDRFAGTRLAFADLSVPVRVLDLGCGAGAVAAAVRHRHPTWDVHASDVDVGALVWARRNARAFGFRVHEGSWFDALPRRLAGSLDVVVAHLPYVPTAEIAHLPRDFRDHEPLHTVDGGEDGLDPLRVVAGSCAPWLTPAGFLLTQVARHQSATVTAIAAAAGLSAELIAAPGGEDQGWEDGEEREDTVVRLQRTRTTVPV